jgi:hypothetical protein
MGVYVVRSQPIDRLILLAEVLDTSVDHLISGHHNAKHNMATTLKAMEG